MKRFFVLILSLSLLLAGCASDAGSTVPESSSGIAEPAPEASEVPSEAESQIAADEPFDMSVFAMDTFMDLRAYGPYAEEALEEASKAIQNLDSLLSVTAESSEIYAVNHSQGEPVPLSEDTRTLLEKALTDRVEDQELYMHAIDASYGYEGYTAFRAEEV